LDFLTTYPSSHPQLEAEVCWLRFDLRRGGRARPDWPWWDHVSLNTKARGKTHCTCKEMSSFTSL